MLQNHVGVAHVSETMFTTEEQTPGLDECQDFVLDLKVASSLPCDKIAIVSTRRPRVVEKLGVTYRCLKN